jgi:hypothetical protein
MAKELPYFKFEPNQWENGNIQMLSREDKGLFIDLCSMYWSRLGDVPLKLATQKLCAGNATALNSLLNENIIEVLDDNVFIKFLSEQLNEFEDTSKQNSKNAKEGWEKRRKQKDESERNATALNSQCENDAIREDKIRLDKIKEENNSIDSRKLKFAHTLKPFLDIYAKETIRDFYDYWTEHGENDKKMRFEKEKSFGLARRLATWNKNNFNNKNNGKQINDSDEFKQIIKDIRSSGERI